MGNFPQEKQLSKKSDKITNDNVKQENKDATY